MDVDSRGYLHDSRGQRMFKLEPGEEKAYMTGMKPARAQRYWDIRGNLTEQDKYLTKDKRAQLDYLFENNSARDIYARAVKKQKVPLKIRKGNTLGETAGVSMNDVKAELKKRLTTAKQKQESRAASITRRSTSGAVPPGVKYLQPSSEGR